MSGRICSGALLLLVAVYLTVGLRHLGVVPPVHEDEPWQASVGWNLAVELADPSYGRIEVYRRRR